MNQNTKKVALVADWITHWGGAERVFAKLMEMYPEADIYTSVFFPSRPEVFEGRRVHTSFIQYIPFLNRRHKMCMLLRPFAFSRFDFSEYDLVISSSSAEAKGIRTRRIPMYNVQWKMKNVWLLKNNLSLNITHWKIKHLPVHLCYCHTPTRYLWSHSEQYRNFLEFGWLNWLAKLIIPVAFRIMKKWDYRAAQRPDIFIANSVTTQERIREYYDRESEVVYPFYWRNNKEEIINNKECWEDDYFVCLWRVVPYKKFDIAIEACNQMGFRLKIFTNTRNPESERLQKLSWPTIEWIYDAPDEVVATALAWAKGFIMPQEEDFGIVALEAMSHGTPVIAYGEGGATETVIHGQTGLFFSEQTSLSLARALQRMDDVAWDHELIREHSMTFSEERFEEGIRRVVAEVCT
jgi:glycosyltransferase involved in cell wall biosynthesis